MASLKDILLCIGAWFGLVWIALLVCGLGHTVIKRLWKKSPAQSSTTSDAERMPSPPSRSVPRWLRLPLTLLVLPGIVLVLAPIFLPLLAVEIACGLWCRITGKEYGFHEEIGDTESE